MSVLFVTLIAIALGFDKFYIHGASTNHSLVSDSYLTLRAISNDEYYQDEDATRPY